MSATRQRGIPCGKRGCKIKIKLLEDSSLECEKCKSRYHLNCSGFNEKVFDVLTENDCFNTIIWCCSICRPKVRQILDSIEDIEKKLEKINTRMDEFKATVDGRLEKIELKINNNECQVNDIVEDKIKTIESDINLKNKTNAENILRVKTLEEKINTQNEISEKERRAKNIVLFNIPEPTSDSAKERIKEECLKLKNIFEGKNLTLDPDKIDDIFRLGKKENTSEKPRPLLLKFNALEYKKGVIKFCKHLYYNEDELKIPIYYSNDLTIKKRHQRRTLVEELKRRRKDNNEENIVIRGDKIVKMSQPFRTEVQPSFRKSWAELFK